MHNSSVYIWVWSLCFKSIGWVNVKRNIFNVGSSYVRTRISSYFEKLEKLRFHVCDSNNSQTMNQIKSNQIEENMKDFCIYDSNHNFHLIRIMQNYDSNHKLHIIQITRVLVCHCQVWFKTPLIHESNHNHNLTQIIGKMGHLNQITKFSWLKSSNIFSCYFRALSPAHINYFCNFKSHIFNT